MTNSDCDSAEWKDIGESDLDSQTRSDLESQSYPPDGDDISFPSEDELGNNCGSDSLIRIRIHSLLAALSLSIYILVTTKN